MTDEEFKEKIYNPYLEGWKVIKLIQHYSHHTSEELWEQFTREAARLQNAYPGNKYVDSLCVMLLTAGEYISEENSKTE